MMPRPTPRDLPAWWRLQPEDVTARIVDSVVLTADEFAHTAALDYWDMSAGGHREVVSLLRSAAHSFPFPADQAGELARVLDAVLAEPTRPALTRRLAELVAPGAALGCGGSSTAGSCRPEQEAWRALVMQAVRADATSRLYIHTGSRYADDAGKITCGDIPLPAALRVTEPSLPDSAAPAVGTGATVTVVIPFRDRSDDRDRLRNLLACLSALGDQSLPRAEYRVVVVELDAEPRHAESIRGRADHYLFLSCRGNFNKAWGVNAGVVQVGADSEIICILDADILVDRDFLRRNLARFRARGHQAHWPFRDPLCLDPSSTHAAITRRCLLGEPDIDPDVLRGVRLRQPPGHCVLVRADLFHRIGGMDERFEGWGGEDLDFVFRVGIVGPVDRHDELLVHMFHPRPQITQDGRRFYAGRQLLTWRPSGPIGQLAGPGSSADDDLAGLIENAG
jgi:hypothetical protein